jgi:pimeloyl-ACP methyl ester carboxylesterase
MANLLVAASDTSHPVPQTAYQPLSLEGDETAYKAAYRAQGEGAPVLLLHGFMGSRDCWQGVAPQLAAHYRCISLDLLGFGESSKPNVRYDIAQLVAFVHEFVQQQGWVAPVLIGHSLGGWVAAAYALAYPVHSLVLVAPAGIRDDSFCGRYDHLRPLLWQTPLVDWVLEGLRPMAIALKQRAALEQILWIRRELNTQPAARSFLVDRMRPEDAIDTVEASIHNITVPTLVVAGADDATIPLWHCQTYGDRIPHAQLVVLPEAGHDLPQGHTQRLVEVILPFLTATRPPSPEAEDCAAHP